MPSEVIRWFHYHAAERRLVIAFLSRRRYSYLDVPEAVAAGLRDAVSKGEFFNAQIRDRFKFIRDAETRSAGPG